MREWWRGLPSACGPGEIRLSHLLLIALLVRLPAVFFSRGYEFLDHQYQYVDPAWHLAFGGAGFATHEWHLGLRSWAYPGILAGIFRAIGWLGITDPLPMMTAVRGVHAVMSLLPVTALWLYVVRFRGWRNQRPLLLFFVANPLVLYCAVQPNAIAFATGLSVSAALLCAGPGARFPWLAGLLLGIAFACRFQDAFIGPVLFLALVCARRWRGALWLCAGAAVTVTMQGILDLLTWGSFLGSALAYVRFNVIAGVSSAWGVEPVWTYAAMAAGLLLFVPPFVRCASHALATGGRRSPALLASALFYLGVHSFVEHKALRFVLPALTLLVLVFTDGLFNRQATSRLQVLHRRLFVGLYLTAALVVSFMYLNRGPIEAALALRAQPDFHDELVVVDGSQTSVGGYYYLRRDELHVHDVRREQLADFLARRNLNAPLYLLVVREPLATDAVPDTYAVQWVGSFHDWPDFKQRDRRYVYRVQSAGSR